MHNFPSVPLPLPLAIPKKLQFSAYETSVAYLLETTDDNVVETPDESLTVSIYVPGMFPSFLGDLIAVVEIQVSSAARLSRTRRQCNSLLWWRGRGGLVWWVVRVSHSPCGDGVVTYRVHEEPFMISQPRNPYSLSAQRCEGFATVRTRGELGEKALHSKFG